MASTGLKTSSETVQLERTEKKTRKTAINYEGIVGIAINYEGICH